MYKKGGETMNSILKHIASLAMVLAIVAVPQAAFGATAFDSASFGGSGGLDTYSKTGIPSGTIGGIIANVLQWCLYILGFLAILGFVVSGIFYIMAAGDESMAEKGKTGMVNSIIGVIVALLGYIVLNTVMAVLSAGTVGELGGQP
jgi:hypothetical protein